MVRLELREYYFPYGMLLALDEAFWKKIDLFAQLSTGLPAS